MPKFGIIDFYTLLGVGILGQMYDIDHINI